MARRHEEGQEKPIQGNLENQPVAPESGDEPLLSFEQMKEMEAGAQEAQEGERGKNETIEELKKKIEEDRKEVRDPKDELADKIIERSKDSFLGTDSKVIAKAQMIAEQVRGRGLTVLENIKNDFSDDDLLKEYYFDHEWSPLNIWELKMMLYGEVDGDELEDLKKYHGKKEEDAQEVVVKKEMSPDGADSDEARKKYVAENFSIMTPEEKLKLTHQELKDYWTPERVAANSADDARKTAERERLWKEGEEQRQREKESKKSKGWLGWLRREK
ncbi:MAG: hypothetical protein AABX84_02390 [Nanoarchaeota archaeon]